jgi:hypothetical protein
VPTTRGGVPPIGDRQELRGEAPVLVSVVAAETQLGPAGSGFGEPRIRAGAVVAS